MLRDISLAQRPSLIYKSKPGAAKSTKNRHSERTTEKGVYALILDFRKEDNEQGLTQDYIQKMCR